MSYFNIVAQTTENTVVTEYEPVKTRSDAYQSEAALEKEFIRLLCEQGYENLPIHSEAELIANLRQKLEELNGYAFTDSEWERFFSECIANANDGIEDKTRRIQEDFVQVLRRDTGESKNITLIDKKNIHNNRLQVINQYAVGKEDGARYDNRYDVTVLVNGLPLVHIELKRRGVAIREAFNQIDRYQRDSFWAGSGLYEYVQIFVISNGTNTKYYSNTTRWNAIRESTSAAKKKKKTSNSFEFTSFWADANNRILPDLMDFTRTFFAKHTQEVLSDRPAGWPPYRLAGADPCPRRQSGSTTGHEKALAKRGGDHRLAAAYPVNLRLKRGDQSAVWAYRRSPPRQKHPAAGCSRSG